MKTLSSQGVSGTMPVAQALRQLLAGTGVAYQMTGTGQAILEFEHARSSDRSCRNVRRRKPTLHRAVAGSAADDHGDSERSNNEQGATSLTDALRNVPGLTIAAGEGGTPAGDNLTLRGNSARNDIFVDGVRDLNPQTRDPFNLEQIEVTKGPTSAVSGRGSAGGTINLISKAPNLDRIVGGPSRSAMRILGASLWI